MKKVIFSLLLASLLAYSCSAEVLMTAKPQGMGNVSWQTFTSNTPMKVVQGSTIITGMKFVYGLNEYTDFLIKAGSARDTFTDSNSSATENGVGVKYAIPKSMWDTPLDVAAVFNTDSISGKDFTQSMTTMGLLQSVKLSSGLELYSLFFAMQDSSKIAGGKSESSNDIMWGFGTKYTFYESRLSWLSELLNYTMSGDTFHTTCFAVQYDFM